MQTRTPFLDLYLSFSNYIYIYICLIRCNPFQEIFYRFSIFALFIHAVVICVREMFQKGFVQIFQNETFCPTYVWHNIMSNLTRNSPNKHFILHAWIFFSLSTILRNFMILKIYKFHTVLLKLHFYFKKTYLKSNKWRIFELTEYFQDTEYRSTRNPTFVGTFDVCVQTQGVFT